MSSFYNRFCECAERWPDHVALEIQRQDHIESYTYAEVRKLAESVARWLRENQYRDGARVAILADNHPRWVAAYLGIIAAGCTAVPLDTALRPQQTAKLLEDSGTSLVICDPKHLDLAEESAASSLAIMLLHKAADNPPTRRQMADLDAILNAGPGDFRPPAFADDAIACLLYTSGTTADPKGVMLSQANLMGEVKAVFGWADIGPTDAILGVLPLFHVLSQMANIFLPLVRGTRVVFLETLNTTELLRALSERRITGFAVVPQFFYLIHERIFKEIAKRGFVARYSVRILVAVTRFSRRLGFNPGKLFFPTIHKTFGENMRYLVTGGSRFDPQIAADFQAVGIDVLQAYGLTETCGAACATPPDDIVIGSVGPPLTGVEIKIMDPQPQEGLPQVGEILIRGAIVMKGYWNRPDATANTVKNDWLYTGDLGYLDAAGNLFITGRKKEVIILSNGKNVYPEEVEAHYLKSPYFKEICVVGLEGAAGDFASDRLHAVIVPNFEVLRQRKIVNAKEVIRYDIESLGVQLPSTKRVGSYEIWQEDLPRTTTRKIKRFEVETRVRLKQSELSSSAEVAQEKKPLTPEDAAWLEQTRVQSALRIIGEASRKSPDLLRPGDNLELDLGLDSMQRVELLGALRQELGGDLTESRLAEIYTVRELVDEVLRSGGAGAAPLVKLAGWQTVLAEEPTDPEVLALARPHRISESFWFVLTRMAAMFCYDRFKLKVTGVEKLPASGPFLICPNHQSFIDGVVMSSVLPWQIFRDIFFVGTSEIFGAGFMRILARWLRIMVVDPDANLVPAMRAGAFGLRHHQVLVLYPEGERSIDGTPKAFKKGAAILSIHMQAPIVPVAIEGFHDAWPRGKKFFQKLVPLQIAFGDPIFPPPETEASEAAYDKLTAEVRASVVDMWEQLRRFPRSLSS